MPGEQEATLWMQVSDTWVRQREKNLTNNQGLCLGQYSFKRSSGLGLASSLQEENKLVFFLPPTIKKVAQCLVELLKF